MDTVTMVMVGLAVALLIYALIRGGGLANDGVKLAGKTLWNALPLLLAGFLIGGLVQVLLPPEFIWDYPEKVDTINFHTKLHTLKG